MTVSVSVSAHLAFLRPTADLSVGCHTEIDGNEGGDKESEASEVVFAWEGRDAFSVSAAVVADHIKVKYKMVSDMICVKFGGGVANFGNIASSAS